MLLWMQTQVPNPPKEKEGHKGSRNGLLRKRKICYHQIFLVFHWVESRVSRKTFLFHTFVSCGVPCFFCSGTKPKINKMNISIHIFPNVFRYNAIQNTIQLMSFRFSCSYTPVFSLETFLHLKGTYNIICVALRNSWFLFICTLLPW